MTDRRPTLRDAQVEATRERILQAAFALVERGEEPNMRAVAREAEVGERTIYRYFDTHDALAIAMGPLFVGRTGVPLPERFAGIEDYARSLFSTFDRNPKLVQTMNTAPWMAPHLERTRRRNLDELRRLIDAAFPEAPEADRVAAASALRVALSGSGWCYLRLSCGLPNEEVITRAIWLCRGVADQLRRCTAAG